MPKRILAAALCLHTLVVTSGAPLPLAWVTALSLPAGDPGDMAERFPCEACPCGCGTAEHCWTQCCCHTLPQRLAWARREGVRPPEEVLHTAHRSGIDVSDWVSASDYRVQPQADAVVETPVKSLDELPACCRRRLEAQQTASQPTAEREQEPEPSKPAPGVALLQALACQGVAEAWLSLGEAPSPPPVELIDKRASAPAVERIVLAESLGAEAPTPPPPERRAATLS